jgi:hypothetical protein
MYGFSYSLDYVCSLNILEGGGADLYGETPEGVRLHAFLRGGSVEGERLRGIIRPVGGSGFSLFRHDDICDIDLRMCLEMHDGALIYLCYGGVFDLGPGGVRRMLAGELRGRMPMRTVPRMLTSDARYAWVNRRQFVGIGEIDFDANTVQYDIYALA